MRCFRKHCWVFWITLVLAIFIFPSTHASEDKLASSGEEQSIPFKTNAPDQDISITRVGLSFLLLVGILIAGLYGFQRLSGVKNIPGSKKYGRINVLESKGLPGKSTISLIGVDKREYLVVRTPQNVSILEHRTEDEPGS